MPRPSLRLIQALRETANRIEDGAHYEWGHMAHCNCGHLAQTVTDLSAKEISSRVKHSLDEWSEYANDVCTVTGRAVDELLDALEEVGFSRDDVKNLEWLSDRRVLKQLGEGVYLQRNERGDLITYLRTMAELLECDMQLQLVAASAVSQPC